MPDITLVEVKKETEALLCLTLHTKYLKYLLDGIKEGDKEPYNGPSVSLLLTVHQE